MATNRRGKPASPFNYVQYLNPYCLLNVRPGSSDDTPEALKLRKRELISQISLDGDIQLDGQIIDRPRALGILEDLDSEKKRNFHSRIFRSEELHNFLRFGVISNSLKIPKRPDEFVDFVRPHLVNSYIAAVYRLLNDSESESIAHLFDTPFPFNTDELSKAYRPIRRHFRQLENALSQACEDIKSGELEYSEIWVDGIIPTAQIDCLNALPSDLEDLNDEVANALNSIGVALYNDVEEIVGAKALFGRAARISSSAQTKERIIGNLKIADNSVHRELIAAVAQELKVLIAEVKDHRVGSSDDIVKAAFAIVDTADLSALQSSTVDSELINISKQLQELAWLCVTSYRSSAAGSVLLNLCLEIELSESKLTNTLHKKIREVQISLTHSLPPPSNEKSGGNRSNDTSNKASSGNSGRRRAAPRANNQANLFNPTVTEDQGIFTRMGNEIRSLSLGNAVLIALAVAGLIILGMYNSKTSTPTKSLANNSSSNSGSNPSVNSANNGIQTVNSATHNTNSTQTSKSTAQQTTRPVSGTVIEKTKGAGLGRLRISNGLSDDGIVKLRIVSSGITFRSVYVRSSTNSTITGIPPGDYEVIVATGYNYSPIDKLFLGSPKYERMSQTFTYEQVRESGGTRFKVFEIELEKSRYGNLGSSTIDSTEFNK